MGETNIEKVDTGVMVGHGEAARDFSPYRAQQVTDPCCTIDSARAESKYDLCSTAPYWDTGVSPISDGWSETFKASPSSSPQYPEMWLVGEDKSEDCTQHVLGRRYGRQGTSNHHENEARFTNLVQPG